MPDSLARSLRYRQRAAECRRLASLADSEHLRAEDEKLALQYEEIAEAELKLANAERLDKAN